MKLRIKKHQTNKAHQFNRFKLVFLLCFSFLFSFQIIAQDSIALPDSLNEKKELEFQQFFFKALSEKAIHNFQKAIENLESCHQIFPDDVAVFFEFSKNYFALNNFLVSKEYIQRALLKEPDNKWMLMQLVAILSKEKNYAEAIKIQEDISKKNPEDFSVKEVLVKLYIRNKEPQKALLFLKQLEQEKGLTGYLQHIKLGIDKKKEVKTVSTRVENTSYIAVYKAEQTYASLEKLLKNSQDPNVLLTYSAEGVRLFPAQPYVYLIQGRELNTRKQYQKALTVLKDGVDFVIDDVMEQNFYRELAKSYKGLGKPLEQKKYLNKINN